MKKKTNNACKSFICTNLCYDRETILQLYRKNLHFSSLQVVFVIFWTSFIKLRKLF